MREGESKRCKDAGGGLGRVSEGLLLAEIMTCDGRRKGRGRGVRWAWRHVTGSCATPASCGPAGPVQDPQDQSGCAGRHVTRIVRCRKPCLPPGQVVHPGWAIHRDHRGRRTALSGSVPHCTAHVMARACCWMSPCRVVVVLTCLLRSFLRPSQHLLRLCSSPGTIDTLPLPRISPPRFFLSSCSCSCSSTLSRVFAVLPSRAYTAI